MEMSEEEKVEKKLFLDSIWDKMYKYSIPLECVYKANQTGLFFNKLPNRMLMIIVVSSR
jgi:hypothetical protein